MQSLTTSSDTSNLPKGESDETCPREASQKTANQQTKEKPVRVTGLLVLIVLGLFFAALAYGGFFDRLRTTISSSLENYFHSAGIVLQKIHIKGQVNLSDEQIIKALGIRSGQSFVGFDAVGAQKQLARLGRVKSARVMRLLPSMLLVEIEERKPFVRWLHKGKMVLVDNEGVLLQELTLDQQSPYPLVTGAGASEKATVLIRVLSTHEGLAEHVKLAERVGEYRWNLHAKNGAVIKLPRNDLALGLARFVALPDWRNLLVRKNLVVDLRQSAQVFVNANAKGKTFQFAPELGL